MNQSAVTKNTIWFSRPDIKQLNQDRSNSLLEQLDITCDEVGDDFIRLSMPVDARTHQPFGILHGGASTALAETAGSLGALHCIDQSKFNCFGIEINANHVRSVRTGRVNAVARPMHLGRSTHVWSIQIENDSGLLVCVSRLTVAVKTKP